MAHFLRRSGMTLKISCSSLIPSVSDTPSAWKKFRATPLVVAISCMIGCSDSNPPDIAIGQPDLGAAENTLELNDPSPLTSTEKKPNIVLVVSDDQRWDLMSGLNHDFVKTPHLDAMAETGTLMQNAFVPVALCSPSRGALLTGREVFKASAPRIVWRNNSFLETQETIAVDIQAAGYETAYIGKWHLGEGSKPKPGFDHWESFDWLGDFFDPVIWVNGQAQQFDGFVDDILARRAQAVIEASEGSDKPLFMVVGLKQPHLHFEHPPRHDGAFDNVSIPQPPTYNEDFAESGKLQEIDDWLGIENFPCGLACFGDSWDNFISSHYSAIQGLDDAIGTIRNAINNSTQSDNTLFVYTSDNGYSLGDHGLTEKHFVYEEPIRVPLLVDVPGDAGAGLAPSEMVSTIDIAPTIFDYADIERPSTFVGRSLRPLIEGGSDVTLDGNAVTGEPWRDELFFMYEKAQVAVRTEDMKLIRSLTVDGHFELYDLANDPTETRTVFNDPDYQASRVEMQRRLKAIINNNQWSARKTYPVRSMLVSQPFATADADRIAMAVSSASTTPLAGEQTVGQDNFPLQWQELAVGTDRFEDRFLLKEDPLAQDGQSVLAILPMELLTDWDSFIEVKTRRRTSAAMYHGGRELWNNTALERLPLDAANPPLYQGENFVVLRFDDTGAMDVKVEIESPEDTIQLPLEDGRTLGNAPGRFFAVHSWQPQNDVELAYDSTGLRVTATGDDSQLLTENVYAEEPVTLNVTYTAEVETPVSIFWRSPHENFAGEKRTDLVLEAGNKASFSVEIEGISEQAVLDALRVDLNGVDSELVLHNLELAAGNGVTAHQWQF